jgi:hypothetical protein
MTYERFTPDRFCFRKAFNGASSVARRSVEGMMKETRKADFKYAKEALLLLLLPLLF